MPTVTTAAPSRTDLDSASPTATNGPEVTAPRVAVAVIARPMSAPARTPPASTTSKTYRGRESMTAWPVVVEGDVKVANLRFI
ncbi:hypothetical protein Atai01_56330 [Amycolatopsis taiwanensis]|uniref:Uncharacterized protein n=1 Tax=Amycolatopsis taiwanensis TaxID=342230 RepID=A0A9W6R4L0_9PSEU|nr:hypothetical protein Atai01_56330 [Amycolatopsis taiwanensis]